MLLVEDGGTARESGGPGGVGRRSGGFGGVGLTTGGRGGPGGSSVGVGGEGVGSTIGGAPLGGSILGETFHSGGVHPCRPLDLEESAVGLESSKVVRISSGPPPFPKPLARPTANSSRMLSMRPQVDRDGPVDELVDGW